MTASVFVDSVRDGVVFAADEKKVLRRFDIALLFLKQCAAASYRVKHSVETVQDCALLWFCVVNGINNSVFWLPNLGSNQGPTD